MRRLFPLIPVLLLTCLLFSCHKRHHHRLISGPPPGETSGAVLTGLILSPQNPIIRVGDILSFQVDGTYDDGSRRDVTGLAAWTSSDPEVATIGSQSVSSGVATAHRNGFTTITATLNQVSASTTLTVGDLILLSIAVTPGNPTVDVGDDVDFKATGTYSNQTTRDLTLDVLWTSSAIEVATINEGGEKGHTQTHAAGTTTITAALGEVRGETTLTVREPVLESIAVTPTNPRIALGTTIRFTATGTYDNNSNRDLTSQVAWRTSDPGVAGVSNVAATRGAATGAGLGTATITAELGGVSGSTLLTVTPAELRSIAVTPTNPSIPLGTSLQFAATGTFTDNTTQDLTSQASWSSSDAGVAPVSNDAATRGLASAGAVGATTIGASLGEVSGSTRLTVTAAALISIAVTPPGPSIIQGTTRQFAATGTYTDSTTQDLTSQATWASSDAGVASVSDSAGSKGLASGLQPGTTTISATRSGVTGSTGLTVTRATLLSITVAPLNPSIALGTTQAFQASGRFDNGATQDVTATVTWSSSETGIATISNAAGSRGVAQSVSIGVATITAALGDVRDSTTLTVTQAALVSISVIPTNPTVALGTSVGFIATGSYTDASSQPLTPQVLWRSSAEGVATVSNAAGSKGVAQGVSPGATTISASLGEVSGSTGLTVTAAALVSIAISPENPAINAGKEQPFRATGSYSDRTSQDLTTQATWSSSDSRVASVSNAEASKGLATGLAEGSATITASRGEVSGSTGLTVLPAESRFIRCDSNQDGKTNIADGVMILNRLFRSGPELACLKAADCNDDGSVVIQDALYCFNYQLRGGSAPPSPFPGCGADGTGDPLTCEAYARCR